MPKSSTGKVNFFVVGAPKCGSTALRQFLSSHPQVDFGKRKEPHMFVGGLKLRGAAVSVDEYHSGYDFSSGGHVFGDASIMHLYSADSAALIRDYNPNAKILIMLRPPVSFVPSYFNEAKYNHIERSFTLREGWNLAGGSRDSRTIPSMCPDSRLLDYKSVAYFDEQILRYLKCFPVDQIRVAYLQDIIDRPRDLYMALQQFLGIQDDGRQTIPKMASTKSYASTSVREAVYVLKHPTVQRTWKAVRSALGIERRFSIVNRVQLRGTVEGVRELVDESLLLEIEDHNSRSWWRSREIASSIALLD